MVIVRKSLEEIKASPAKMTDAQRARLKAMSDAQVEAAAQSDPDAQLRTTGELDRMALARLVRETRVSTGLSQTKFAHQFRFHPSRIKDWEQGRFMPDDMAVAYLKVIREAAPMVMKVLGDIPAFKRKRVLVRNRSAKPTSDQKSVA